MTRKAARCTIGPGSQDGVDEDRSSRSRDVLFQTPCEKDRQRVFIVEGDVKAQAAAVRGAVSDDTSRDEGAVVRAHR